MVHLLVFSHLVFSCMHCFFIVTMLTTSCSHLPSLSLPISLLSKDLLSTRECFSLDFGKFSTICLFICSVCYCFSNCVGLVCLERKWTYRCPDFGLFSLSDHSCCFLGQDMDVLMPRFSVFRSPCSLLCHHCICVVVSRFLLSSVTELVL